MEFDFMKEDAASQDMRSLETVVKAFKEANNGVKNKFPSHWEFSMAQKFAAKLDTAIAEFEKEMIEDIEKSNS